MIIFTHVYVNFIITGGIVLGSWLALRSRAREQSCLRFRSEQQ